MKTFKTLFVLFALILVLASCNDDEITPNTNFENQKIVFQYEYINYAWGYTHHGWLMDTAGNVYCYNLPDNWVFIGESNTIKKDSMEYNLAHTDSNGTRVAKATVDEKMELIQQAKQGALNSPEEVMCDAGIGVFYAFVYNEANDTYEAVLLRQTGDLQIINDSQAAMDLYAWMVGINTSLYYQD